MLAEYTLATRSGRRSHRRVAGRFVDVVGVAALGLWTIAALLPILASVLSSFRTNTEIITSPLALPHHIVWNNFSEAWSGPPFGQAIWHYAVNSAIAVGVGVAVGVSVGTVAGYALARSNSRFALMNRYFVLLLTIPTVITWVPLFSLMSSLNLLSNRVGLGLVYAAQPFVIPLVAVLMRSYFASFPLDLIEAAKIDGASETQAFLRIVLPTSLGMISVVALTEAIWLWNELALAVILMLTPSSQTLPVGLIQFRNQFVSNSGYGAQYAGLVLAILPVVMVYVFTQRRITEGMRLGALK